MTDLNLPVGDTLTSVSYELLSWEEIPSIDAPADQVAMAVRLDWHTSPATRITWSADAERDGLVQCGIHRNPSSPELEIVDVSERWSQLVGQPLVACTLAHSAPPSDLPWAINLQFASGAHLVIALGELLDDEPSYIPDSLLITGLREVADSFSPRAALGSAWSDRRD